MSPTQPEALIAEFEKEFLTFSPEYNPRITQKWTQIGHKTAQQFKQFILKAFEVGEHAERERIGKIMHERILHAGSCLNKDCYCGAELLGIQYLISHLTKNV